MHSHIFKKKKCNLNILNILLPHFLLFIRNDIKKNCRKHFFIYSSPICVCISLISKSLIYFIYVFLYQFFLTNREEDEALISRLTFSMTQRHYFVWKIFDSFYWMSCLQVYFVHINMLYDKNLFFLKKKKNVIWLPFIYYYGG